MSALLTWPQKAAEVSKSSHVRRCLGSACTASTHDAVRALRCRTCRGCAPRHTVFSVPPHGRGHSSVCEMP
eukprot:3833064-Pleurochrysis_carterae.AAC.4